MGRKLVHNYKDHFKNGIYSKTIETKTKHMEVNYVHPKVAKAIRASVLEGP